MLDIETLPAAVDLAAVKGRQQAAWASGDYAIVGTTLQIVGETLCEAVDLRGGQRVLDVAAGNGNATLAAARRFADVVSTDYVGALLERGRERAKADRLPVTFQEADAEALPFADASFDVVLSTFGVMFTPDQQRAADEMMRVCRPGGKIGLASWTPPKRISRSGHRQKELSPAASDAAATPRPFARDANQTGESQWIFMSFAARAPGRT
jgi:ubiquinone/menaquinone biosynthesis C-methylase UbiE